jgi:predicted helicase
VGIITNHSFLDNPTFRGMRQSLMNTFDQLYFVDLHGNAKKKEKTPEGEKDENVFDIEQGVCMSFFVKKKGLKKGVFHADFWGNRKTKFKLCLENNLKTVNFEELKPNSPFYLFVPQNQDFRRAYDEFWSVKDIFELNSVGVVTGRDEFTVKSTADEVWKTVHDFVKLDENTARKKYKLGKDSRDWQVKLAQEDLKTTGLHKNLITKINYRPFDVRYTYYTGNSRGFLCMPRKNVMQHFEKENFGLVTVRQVAEGVFNHAFVTEILCNFRVTLSNKGGAYIFPFYRYNGNGKDANDNYLFKENDKKDNFTDNFREFIRKKYRREWSIEQIAGYIYAVLHGKSYREKYSDFLKMDFPRIPFTDSAEIFEKISALGCELIDKHLLKNNFSLKELPDIGEYIGAGDNVVIKPEFKIIHAENQTFSRLYINKTQYFETVTEEIYDFCIGGYRVLDKFLKDRKDKSIAHELFLITDIIKTLHFTLQIMKNIDEEMKGWI